MHMMAWMGDVLSLHQLTGWYGGVNRFTTICLHDSSLSRPTSTCMHLSVMYKRKQTNFSVFFNMLAPKKTYSACSVTQPVDQSLPLTTANRLPHKHEALARCWADVIEHIANIFAFGDVASGQRQRWKNACLKYVCWSQLKCHKSFTLSINNGSDKPTSFEKLFKKIVSLQSRYIPDDMVAVHWLEFCGLSGGPLATHWLQLLPPVGHQRSTRNRQTTYLLAHWLPTSNIAMHEMVLSWERLMDRWWPADFLLSRIYIYQHNYLIISDLSSKEVILGTMSRRLWAVQCPVIYCMYLRLPTVTQRRLSTIFFFTRHTS